jgi:hypothetical protein
MLQGAQTGNVLSVDPEESVETLNMQNLDGAYGMARTNIVKNIATAAGMPAKMLDNETLTEGFGEGTEDAKQIARYIDRIRLWLMPAYDFLDEIVQRRAWNDDFYASVQEQFPDEYGSVPYEQAFAEWKNSFTAVWPSLLKEPESDQVKVDETKLRGMISAVEVLIPTLDPENKARLIDWFQSNLNENRVMFSDALELDIGTLEEYLATQSINGDENGEEEPEQLNPKPKGLRSI